MRIESDRLDKVIHEIGKERPGKTWMRKIEKMGLRRGNMVSEINILARDRGNLKN